MAEEARKSSLLHKAADAAESFLEDVSVWIAALAVVALILVEIPGIEDVAVKIGLENSQRLRTGVFVVLLTAILLELRQVKRRVTPASTGRQHYVEPQDMYTALAEKAKAVADPAHYSLDVLGLTLASAWPPLSFLLQSKTMNNWTVRLATLSHNADVSSLWIPKDWPQESATTAKRVLTFAAGHGKTHNHKIKIYEYNLSPAVHGFRLGNGDVFISTLLWQENGCLDKPGFAYDYVPWYDTSPWAIAMRELFENWFDRVLLSSSGGDREGRSPSSSPAG